MTIRGYRGFLGTVFVILLSACSNAPEEQFGSARQEGVPTDAVAARAGGDVGAGADGPGGGRSAVSEERSRSDTAVDRPVVLFFGTSLTAGLGLENRNDAFPGVIQTRIDSAGLDYRIVNAGVPGETSAAGLRRIGWVLSNTANVSALVLELGANDGLRGQEPEALRENLQSVIDSTRAYHPEADIVLAGMEAPPNLGPRYTERFRSVFREVARANDTALIPFLLEGVAGVEELNQTDRIHPTEEGHRALAENVWAVLEPLL